MDVPQIDLNSADPTTLLRETGLDIRKVEVLVNARPFWGDAELRMLPGFGRKTLRELAAVARVVPPSPVNINTCAIEALQGLPGLGAVLAERIISARPFSTLDELNRIKGISQAAMLTLRQRADVADRHSVENLVRVGPNLDLLDLNSCDETSLCELPRVSPVLARRIVSARPFVDVDSLLNVKGISPAIFSSLRPRLSVRARTTSERLDLNTCGPHEMQQLRGVGPELAMRIISGRPYKHWKELLELKGVGVAVLERLRQACELHSMPPTTVEAEFVDDEHWFTEGDFELPHFENASGVPQVRDPVMSLVVYEAVVAQEIRRRMPLFISGWVLAFALIAGVLLLFFTGYLRVGRLIP